MIPVSSREEMAVMLAHYHRRLRQWALRYLPDASSDEVEDIVDRTVTWLLAIERPSTADGLAYARSAVQRECRHYRERLVEETRAVDPVLGPLVGPTAYVLSLLGKKSRQIILDIAHGKTAEQIAKEENRSIDVVRVRLAKARRRALQLRRDGARSLLLLAVRPLRQRPRGPRRRVGRWVQRRTTALSWPGGDALAQMTMVSVVALVSAGAGVNTFATRASDRPAAVGAMPRSVDASATTPAAPPRATAAPVALSGTRPAGARPIGLSDGVSVLVGRLPANETPDDTQLMTAVAAPDYASTHTIVALGLGRSCACNVLFQSADGGATWSASTAPAPLGAEQLALPPDYPRGDPRIFVGTNAQSGGSTYVVPTFGALAMPLPGPSGHLALAAGFDRGDNRVFVAGLQAVVGLSIDTAPPEVTPLLAYPQWPGTPAGVAQPGAQDGSAVVVLAPPGTVMVGAPTGTGTTETTVFECRAGTDCTPRGLPPTFAASLTTAPSGAVAAAWSPQGVAVSSDAGRTFRTISTASLVGFGPSSVAASDGRVWAVLHRGQAVAVAWAPAWGGSWTAVTDANGALRQSGALVAVPGGPLLDLLVGGGVRCTVDGGRTWGSRCP